tara:strand:- start:8855 stop:11395 length:2541 start_codon:yes stop_codon:yes gene_type:complete
MEFLAPAYLLLLFGLPILWVWPRRCVDVRQGVLRTLAVAAIVIAVARPVLHGDEAREHHVLVLDRSPSMPDAEAVLTSARAVVDALPADCRLTVIEFGDAERTGERMSLRDDEHVLVLDRAGSPLGDALAAADRALPDHVAGSVTVIGDGRATTATWGRAIQTLQRRGIPVHSLVPADLDDDVAPVALDPIDELRAGAPARIRVTMTGTSIVNVTLRSIGQDGVSVELARLEGHALATAKQAILEIVPPEAGFLNLICDVELVDGTDSRPGHESLQTTLGVFDPLRVLYLGGRTRGGGAALGDLAGPGFEVVLPAEADDPTALDAIDPGGYDLVVMDDRPAAQVPDAFQKRVVEAVQQRGTGLFFSGGEGSFGPGGWHEQTLSEVLPVESVQKEEKRDPSVALVVVIDTSGSMSGNRVQLAKETARLAIRRLLPHDYVGIVEFFGAKRWAAPIQPASNTIEIERALNRMDAGGGTVILPAIEEAYYGLQNVATRYKHVLVLTDGGVEQGAFEPLLRRMAEEGMNVSTVLVGSDAHSEFLVTLANWGKGRFYSVPNRFNLPEVLYKQPASAKLPAYRPVTTQVRASGGPGWWGDVDSSDLPPISGHTETRMRPGAERILETVDGAKPVIASWRHGLGRVTTFATEPTGAGTESWREWEGYGPFASRLLRRTASDTAHPFDFRLVRDGGRVILHAERRVAQGTPAARVWLGDQEHVPSFEERAPGRFRAEVWVDAETEVRLEGGAAVLLPDSSTVPGAPLVRRVAQGAAPERNPRPSDALDLPRLAAATGGSTANLAPGAILNPTTGGAVTPPSVRDLAPWFAGLALLAYLLELLHRRRPTRTLRTTA